MGLGLRKPVAEIAGIETEPGLIVYRFAVGLFFANATGLAEQVRAMTSVTTPPRWFALLADAMDDVDYTGGRTLVDTARSLHDRGITFAVVSASAKVRRELDAFGLGDVIGEERYYPTLRALREAFAASPASSPGAPAAANDASADSAPGEPRST